MKRHLVRLLAPIALATFAGGLSADAIAQSLTSGTLRGTVTTDDGQPVSGTLVTIEDGNGRKLRVIEADRDGRFFVPLMAPGEYRLLVEQVGYQPVRFTSLAIASGRTSIFTAVLAKKEPPIDRVEERIATFALVGSDAGVSFWGREITDFARSMFLTDLNASTSLLAWPDDGTFGFTLVGNGLPGATTRLMVDGVEETWITRPGIALSSTFAARLTRSTISELAVFSAARDVERRSTGGLLASVSTAKGGNRFTTTGYLRAGPRGFATRAVDNPFDSSAVSVEAGLGFSGPLRQDTAFYAINLDVISSAVPTAHPWTVSSTSFGGNPADLSEALVAIAQDSFSTNVAPYASQAVRRWKGGTVSGRLDWRLSAGNSLMARASVAAWRETNGRLANGLSTPVDNEADGRDVSAAVTLSSSGETLGNEARVGFSASRRDWTASILPYTALIEDGVAFGGQQVLPALFYTKQLDLVDAVQVSRGSHHFKVGGNLGILGYQQRYNTQLGSRAWYSDLTDFSVGRGAIQTFENSGARADFTTVEPSFFLQDVWTLGPEFQAIIGVRYDTQILPKDAIGTNSGWTSLTSIRTGVTPKRPSTIGPRGGFVWNVNNEGRTIVRGGAGLYADRIDPSLFAEAILGDGELEVGREILTSGDWPAVDAGIATNPRLSLFSSDFKAPRTIKVDGSITRSIGARSNVTISGYYGHTDELPRRIDLNLLPPSSQVGPDGRPLFGTLVKVGGLIQADPGSNQRFPQFDHVFGLTSTGFSSIYQLGAEMEHRFGEKVSIHAGYTASRTRDNLIGLASLDLADRLSPFRDLVDGADWTEGRSDLDIPHRLVAVLSYRAATVPLSLGLRGRWRSGLPYTPGFPWGVDINGDGAVGNDPAFLDSDVTDIHAALDRGNCGAPTDAFAERNRCREDGVGALDVALSWTLGTRNGHRLAITLDAFNLLATSSGIVDRALFVVDPDADLTTTPGEVSAPLVLNPRFATLISRRSEPRFLRLGVQLEY